MSEIEILQSPAAAPGLWRSGNVLVVRKGAAFPPRCIKTGAPETNYKEFVLYWFDPLWSFLYVFCFIPFGFLLVLIAIGLATKRVTFRIAISEAVLSQNRTLKLAILVACVIVAAFVPLSVQFECPGVLLLLAPTIFLACFLALFSLPHLRVNRIQKQYVFLNGASLLFLEGLPEFNESPLTHLHVESALR